MDCKTLSDLLASPRLLLPPPQLLPLPPLVVLLLQLVALLRRKAKCASLLPRRVTLTPSAGAKGFPNEDTTSRGRGTTAGRVVDALPLFLVRGLRLGRELLLEVVVVAVEV